MNELIKADDNLFLALGFPAHEAEVLKMRSDIMVALALHIKHNALTTLQAAEQLGISEAQVVYLLRGKWKKFTLDTLITLAARIGKRVRLELDEAA